MASPSHTGPFTLRTHAARNGRHYYEEWIGTLNGDTRRRVLSDVNKLIFGIGFQKSLGDKLWELKIDVGPGYRAYYYKDGTEVILLLAGSDKKRQERTIALCRKLIKEIEEDKKTQKG
jgi:putative addiction module killer protein